MDKVRCAVIGSGFAGSTYAEAIRYAPDAQLVAIADELEGKFSATRNAALVRDAADVYRRRNCLAE